MGPYVPGNRKFSRNVIQGDAGREVETSRPESAPCCLPGGRGNCYANAALPRYCPPVAGHLVGAQVALVSHHVWHRLGSGFAAAFGGTRRGLSQRAGKEPER